MKGTISRILAAIAQALRGFWKATVTAGRITMTWVQERAAPAVGSFLVDAAHATDRTIRTAIHAVPNLLTRPTGSGLSVAPAPTPAAAPLAEQRDARQALLDAALDGDRARGLAINVRACARAVLRGQEPVGLPRALTLWLKSLDEGRLTALASLSTDALVACLDDDAGQPQGLRYRASLWEATALAGPAPCPVPDRGEQPAAPVIDMQAHLSARIQERLRRTQGRPETSYAGTARAVSR